MTKLRDFSLVFCWGLCLSSAPVRGDDAEEKASPPAQVKKEGVIVRVQHSGTTEVALSADGKLLARGAIDGVVDVWDVATGKKLHTLNGHTASVCKVAFSPDGKTLASAATTWGIATPGEKNVGPGEMKLWDLVTGKERVTLKGNPGLALGVGGFMAENAANPGSVQLWDLTTGKKRASMPGHLNGDLSIGFTPDGKTLVTAGDGELKLWDVATAKERATIAIPGQSFPFFPLTFTADSNTLIASIWTFREKEKDRGVSVQHWDLATGTARATFWAPVNTGGGNNAGFFFAALSADGKTVAWGGEEKHPKYMGTAYVWDVESLATSPPKLPGQ